MIYIGNGIYSDASPNEYLAHYGVLGMKWGVHKAKRHLQNIRGGAFVNAKTKQDIDDAEKRYQEDLNSVKEYARQNKKNKAVKVSDIEKIAKDKARKHYGDSYDKMDRRMKVARGLNYGLTGAAAGLGAASLIKQGSQNRKWEKNHGFKNHMLGTHKYAYDGSKGTKVADGLGYGAIGALGASLIPQYTELYQRGKMYKKYQE